MKTLKGQTLWATYYDAKGKIRYQITSDLARTRYNLYCADGSKPVKVKTAASPAVFEEEIGRV